MDKLNQFFKVERIRKAANFLIFDTLVYRWKNDNIHASVQTFQEEKHAIHAESFHFLLVCGNARDHATSVNTQQNMLIYLMEQFVQQKRK